MSIAQAATLLGKSQRQVRYLVQSGQLPATKQGARWRIDSADLPFTDAQRLQLAERAQVARQAFEKGLEPVTRGTNLQAGEEPKRGYSVTDLLAFQTGETIYREIRGALSRDDPAAQHLFEALALLSRGCHCFHPKDKARCFTEAREMAATAVADLFLHDDGTEKHRGFAERIEQELIPKMAGLVASSEKRSRRGRFERFGANTRGR